MVRLLVIGLLMLAGCSSQGTVNLGGEEGVKVAQAVEELNEAKGIEKKVEQFFVSKQGRPSAKELNKFNFYVSGKPKIDGNSATCNVLIEKQDGAKVGEPTWEFEKAGESWKIKSAPLQ